MSLSVDSALSSHSIDREMSQGRQLWAKARVLEHAMCAIKTMKTTAKRHEILEEDAMQPQAREHIQKSRETFWAEELKPEVEQLATTPGGAGWWQVTPQLPRENALGRKVETPYATRPFVLCPKAPERAEGLLKRIGLGACNTKGKKGTSDLTLGQDSFSISRLNNGWEAYCVMDGHGPVGHWPAMRAAQALPSFLDQEPCSSLLARGKVETALQIAFKKTEQDLEATARAEKVELFLSGCTAACCLRHPQQSSVWLAHVGDSRSAMMAPDKGLLRETQDHTPRVESERARVLASGCEVDEETHEDGTSEVRIFVQGQEFPGIMMSRSLGDLSVKDHGVIAEPEVSEWPLDGRADAMVLLASDGVWEFMSTEEVSRQVLGGLKDGRTAKQTVEELVARSRGLWEEHEDDYCDDITALLVPLGGPLPEPGRGGSCMAGVCKLCWPASG